MVEKSKGGKKMKEISFSELFDKAETFRKKSISWHFHVLMKECKFNENNGKFSIVLESPSTNEIFVTYFDKDPKRDAEKLEDLFYRGD